MRTLSLIASLALVAVAGSLPRAGAAPVPKQKDAENPDLAALQGKWVLTGMSLEGRAFPAEIAGALGIKLEFQGDKVTFTVDSERVRTTATAKFDLNAKPRRINLVNEETTDFKGKELDQPLWNLSPLIYRIEGGEFVMASFADPLRMKGTPADFVGRPGESVMAMTFKKAKK